MSLIKCKEKEAQMGLLECYTHSSHLHQFGDHHNAVAVLLPDHPPEIIDHVLLGPCRTPERGLRWRKMFVRDKKNGQMRRPLNGIKGKVDREKGNGQKW